MKSLQWEIGMLNITWNWSIYAGENITEEHDLQKKK